MPHDAGDVVGGDQRHAGAWEPVAPTDPVAPLRVLLGLNDGSFSVRTTTCEPTGDAGVGRQLRKARGNNVGGGGLCEQRREQ